jgi:mRNA-degrading endonuclease RelE of RelBE toxin-antitoxin system
LENYPHQPLQGQPGFKPRVGKYRVFYEIDVPPGRIYLIYVGNRREIYK